MSTLNHLIRFRSCCWSIKDLLKAYHEDKTLNINPHYQRNAVWSLQTQRRLIGTIEDGYPIPTFFLHDRGEGRLDMVDGQQRCRAIASFFSGVFDSPRGQRITKSPRDRTHADYQNALERYPLQVCILDKTVSNEDVERFYVLVNSSGVRLNTPELRKAEFYNTVFLRLATEVAGHPLFQELGLFSDKSTERMNDIDFASELLTFLKCGFTDKKDAVNATYESDVPADEALSLKTRAFTVLERINSLNLITPLSRTRFKQKGDFLTLFAFLAQHPDIPTDMTQHIFQTVLRLAPHIRPSQEDCDPLTDYALQCVSQSNSKEARIARNAFFESLFNNKRDTLNDTQLAIANYFKIPPSAAARKWDRLLLPHESLNMPE